MIKEKEWAFKWWEINNKYGEQIVYEPDQFAKAFEDLSYQQNIKEFLENGEYDVFLDIGAAWGHFSLIASEYCKRVIAFEPHPMRYGFLLYNCRHHFNIECCYEYVSCRGDTPRLGKLEEMVEERQTKPYKVPVITLDDIQFDPDESILVKLDVEGNELKVLQNANYLIKNHNSDCIIYVPNLHGVSHMDIITKFSGFKKHFIQGQDKWCSVIEFTREK